MHLPGEDREDHVPVDLAALVGRSDEAVGIAVVADPGMRPVGGHRVADDIVQRVAGFLIAGVGQNGIAVFGGQQKAGVSVPGKLHAIISVSRRINHKEEDKEKRRLWRDARQIRNELR